MKNYFLLSFLFILLFSFSSYAQLDSVYYQGPLLGSVPSGAIQNTDNFSDEINIVGEKTVVPLPDVKYRDFNPTTINIDEKTISPSVYVEDVPAYGVNAGGQEVILQSYLGIGMTNYIPPDPTMAVGPNHIIVCANSLFKIFDKQGNLLKTIGAGGWWGGVSAYESGDPQVIYDHYAGRWVLVWMEYSANPVRYGDLIAYSDDDNPLGIWYLYRLPLNYWGDYPKLSFDDQALYVMTRMIAGGFFQYTLIRVIKKDDFYAANGGPVSYKDLYNIRTPGGSSTSEALDVIHPGITYTPGDGAWCLWARGSINFTQSSFFYALYKITNPATNPGIRGKVLNVTQYFTPPNAGQLGGGQGLEVIGWMSRAPVIRDGYMYAAHDIRNSTNTAYSSVKYLKIDLSTPSIIENIEFGNTGYYYLYPALTVDKDHNVTITFTRSATSEYAGAFFSTKLASDPLALNPSIAIAEGQGNYVVDFGQGRNRWGDYMGIYLDPVSERNVWMLTEFASATNTWGTQVAEIIPGPFSGVYTYPIPGSYDFNEVETGTESMVASIILANFGDQDLTITNIPSTFNDFNLKSSLSFPVTVASYDSLTLEFTFSPVSEGSVSVVYPVTCNDPEFSGIQLSGTGYDAMPVELNKLYASTGTGSNGTILTVNPASGAGTEIGLSGYNEVISIAVNPLDAKLYGIITGTSSSDLLKINAAEGDAHLLYTIDIPLLAGIAFDTAGTLYGVTRVGDIYTIDLTDGSTSFVVDAEGSYQGLAFNPATNELWASSRALAPPNRDAIFKVNFNTGDTAIVGHTGLGAQTNAIAFDENVNLYGVIGSPSVLNDFISINTSSGVGTVIGSIGYKNVIGLTYSRVTTGVEDENNYEVTPTNYVLRQNYPNPFNPTTKIDFSLPTTADVKLVVYNLLGQELVTLIDNEMTSGNHSITWDAREANGNKLTSGIYFYKLTATGINGSEFQDVKKMILMK